jgi:hypothetical protein
VLIPPREPDANAYGDDGSKLVGTFSVETAPEYEDPWEYWKGAVEVIENPDDYCERPRDAADIYRDDEMVQSSSSKTAT